MVKLAKHWPTLFQYHIDPNWRHILLKIKLIQFVLEIRNQKKKYRSQKI